MYTYIMRRTQIYLTDEEAQALKRASKKGGASMSDLIRSAIDETYVRGDGQPPKEQALRMINESFGAWQGRTETGEEYVERMRSGRLGRLHGWRDEAGR
jgi:Ribbon-helix-helix protein, copG family